MPTSFLTREGYKKLQDELEFLRTQKRQEIAQRLHEAIEGSRLAVVPQAGHLVMMERPEEFNRLLAEFLTELNG